MSFSHSSSTQRGKQKEILFDFHKKGIKNTFIQNIFVQAFELEIHIWHATEQITFGVFWDETQQLVQGIENRDASK